MRCFVAIELPSHIRQSLAALQVRLGGMGGEIRWTRSEQIHLTLQFLGEVADAQVPQVCQTLETATRSLRAIPLDIRGTGCFPPSGPVRVVWAGISGPRAELTSCHAACEHALADLGYAPETRAFRPHLTLGRSRDPRGARAVRAAVAQAGDFACTPFIAHELVLMQSVLAPSGAVHTPLAHYPFNDP